MLKKENRLNSKYAFNATYKNKIIISSDLLIMYVGKRKENEIYPTRVGFVVSKKIHKRAVRRNRIRRLISESVRNIIKSNAYPILNEFQSFIILPKYDISDKTYNEIYESVSTLLNILLNKLANKKI